MKAYLEQGGTVIYVAAYEDKALPNLDALLSDMGLSMAEGMIVETSASNYYRNPYYLLPSIGYSDYTENISGQYYVFAPLSRGILWATDREDVTFDAFLKSSNSSFAKAGSSNSMEMNAAEGDTAGPFAIGVEAVKTLEDGTEARLVAFSCSQIFTDDVNNAVAGGNLMVFSNCLGTLSDLDVSVSIAAKAYDLSLLTVNEAEVFFFGILLIVVLPLGCLIAGFIIWLRRRKR